MSAWPIYALREIEVENFRRFQRLRVTFEPDVTVLVSRNAGGKSAVLDAVAKLLVPFIAEFGAAGPSFLRSDVRLEPNPFVRVQRPEALPMVARARGDLDGELEWFTEIRQLAKRARPTTINTRGLRARAAGLRDRMAAGEPVIGPVFAYYGTGRLWRDDTTRSTTSGPLVQSAGYDRALTSQSAFKQLESWMEQEAAVDLQAADAGSADRSDALKNVQQACDIVLAPSGWRGVHYDWRLRTIVAKEDALGTLRLGQLSDGVRSMLALAADIALRCSLVNPTLGVQALETPGIVLIDEVDLHLHPEWQFEVVPLLRRAFPRIQFILSTHSPQVLASVDGRSLRTLEPVDLQADESTGFPVAGQLGVKTLGRPSYLLMDELQHVKPRPDNDVTKRLNEYKAMVRAVNTEPPQAEELRTKLEHELGRHDPTLARERRRLGVEPTS